MSKSTGKWEDLLENLLEQLLVNLLENLDSESYSRWAKSGLPSLRSDLVLDFQGPCSGKSRTIPEKPRKKSILDEGSTFIAILEYYS